MLLRPCICDIYIVVLLIDVNQSLISRIYNLLRKKILSHYPSSLLAIAHRKICKPFASQNLCIGIRCCQWLVDQRGYFVFADLYGGEEYRQLGGGACAQESRLGQGVEHSECYHCLLYTSPSPRDRTRSRMPSSA